MGLSALTTRLSIRTEYLERLNCWPSQTTYPACSDGWRVLTEPLLPAGDVFSRNVHLLDLVTTGCFREDCASASTDRSWPHCAFRRELRAPEARSAHGSYDSFQKHPSKSLQGRNRIAAPQLGESVSRMLRAAGEFLACRLGRSMPGRHRR